MKKMMSWILGCSLILVAMFSAGGVHADDVQGTLPLNVRMVDTKHVSKSPVFYQLEMNQGKRVPLTFDITNSSKTTACRIKSNVNSASTTSKLALFYQGNQFYKLPFKMSKIVSYYNNSDRDFVLQPGQTQRVKLLLDTQSKKFAHFNGEILGAVTFAQQAPTVKNGINNQFSYTVPIEVKHGALPPVQLRELSVDSHPKQLKLGRVTETVANASSNLLNNVQVQSEIINTGNSEQVSKLHLKGGQIAPNSRLELQQPLKNKLLPGKYEDVVKVSGTDSTSKQRKSWLFTKEFKIKAADYFDSTPWILWLVIGLIAAVLLSVIGWLSYHIYQNQKR